MSRPLLVHERDFHILYDIQEGMYANYEAIWSKEICNIIFLLNRFLLEWYSGGGDRPRAFLPYTDSILTLIIWQDLLSLIHKTKFLWDVNMDVFYIL